MKIIILGAGQVGGTLAENLVGEQNEITVVDIDGNRLRELQDKYDSYKISMTYKVLLATVLIPMYCVVQVPKTPI